MKGFNNNRLLVLLPAVIIGVLMVVGVVSAASTIGTDISTDGNLSVTGTSTFTGDSTFLGNVGIGTTTPETALDVVGDFQSSNYFRIGPPETALNSLIQGYTFAPNVITVLNPSFSVSGTNAVGIEAQGDGNGGGDITGLYSVALQTGTGRKAYGAEGDGIITGDGGTAYGVSSFPEASGAINATQLINFYAFVPAIINGATAWGFR